MANDDLMRLLEVLRQENAAAAAETRRHFDATVSRFAAETQRHFDVSTEAVKHDVRLLAEAVGELNDNGSRQRCISVRPAAEILVAFPSDVLGNGD